MSESYERNAVVIFSSGIALYKRGIRMRAGEKRSLSLPVKREHLDNLLRSFSVKGQGLSWSRQASYSNGQQSHLALDPSAVTESLLTNLAGAKIKLNLANGQSVCGTLLGLDTRIGAAANGQSTERKFFAVRTRKGNVSVNLDEVQDYRFTDKVVRDQVNLALAQHFQKIKPDATTFDFELSAREDAEAAVLYTQPAAAWKLSYRLREAANNRFDLEAFAVVDNNTAQDWSNYDLSIVSGDPIHFASNIADVVMPARKFVNAISAEAAGPVDAEAGLEGGLETLGGGRAMAKNAMRMRSAAPMAASFGGPAAMMADAGPSAFTPQTETSEVGDFSVYTSQEPVTINAGRSGLIPLFQLPLEDARSFLFYDPRKDASRPWRAVRFKAPASFGRGLCTVFLKSDHGDFFGGECTLEAAKTGEDRLVVHQRETGVKVRQETKPTETRRISVQITDGVLLSEVQYTQQTTYIIRNSTGTDFSMALDHSRQFGGDSKLKASCDSCDPQSEKLSNGSRFTVSLAPNAEISVTVTEEMTNNERIEVGPNPAHFTQWLRNNLITVHNPVAHDSALLKCFEIQSQIDQTNRKLADERTRQQELEREQNELRQNLQAAGESAPYRKEWQQDLYENQKALRTSTKDTQPAIRKELEGLQATLLTALRDLTVNWKE